MINLREDLDWGDFGYFAGTLIAGMAFISCLTQLQNGGNVFIWWSIAGFAAWAMTYYNKKSRIMQSLIDVEKVPLKEYWNLLVHDPRLKRKHNE